MISTSNILQEMASNALLRRQVDTTLLAEPDVTNSIWQAEVTGSYWSAREIGQAILSRAGNEIVSPAGKFWKRAKEIIRQCIVDSSTLEVSSWTDTDWSQAFDRLRVKLQVVSGGASLPKHRSYYVIPAQESMMLGQWFSFHHNSCWWTSYERSMVSFMAGGGYMIRGMWTSKAPTLEKMVTKIVGSRGQEITLPKLTDYRDNAPDAKWHQIHRELGVRCMVQPLNNGLFACFNGYMADLWESFDFTARTRLHAVQKSGDVMPVICNDIARIIQESTGTETGVRQFRSNHEHAFINNDKYYLIGDVNNPYISNPDRCNLDELSFRRYVDTPMDWEDNSDFYVAEDYLDSGWSHGYRNENGERYVDPDHEDDDDDNGGDDD
jgi:hypothetical protein